MEPPGIVLHLENGVIMRGDQKEAFRDGTYEIFLPRADPEDWREAALPGFEEPAAEGEG